MPKFRVKVTEDVTMVYEQVEIEADEDWQAQEIAEDMRAQGALGEAQFVSVDEVDYEVHLVLPPESQTPTR
jgi:hypothetical protein